jgi:GT2 family glycosyltransferase
MTTRVIVLNWNGRRWLDGCLAALEAQTLRPTEVVVVDNGSTDDSVAHLRARWPHVRVIALPENSGFAAGNNRGADDAATDCLVFLNNDTEPEPGWLEALVRAAGADPARGLVSSCIVYLDDPSVVDSAGDGYLRCGGGFKYGHGQPASQWTQSRDVFGACGAAFLIRREVFAALGGFDESFFMVYEDVDLSYRAQLRGARVWYAADAVVRHAGSASMGRVSDLAVFHGQRNLEWTWIRNTPAPLLWRSLPAHLAYTAAGALGYLRQGRFGPWLRGKVAALAGAGHAWRLRASSPAASAAERGRLWALMEPDWIARKRAEKRFDFSP